MEPEVICQKGLGSLPPQAYKLDGGSKSFQGKTMKTQLLALAVALLAADFQTPPMIKRVIVAPARSENPLDTGVSQRQAAAAAAVFEKQAEILAARQRELAEIYSKDPWRKIGDSTNRAFGKGWVEFQGIVQETGADGVVFEGAWGQVLTIHPWEMPGGRNARGRIEKAITYGDSLFFVEDFPYPATGGKAYAQMLALDAGFFSYTNAAGQALTLPKLIYGTPCVKTWSAEEIAAAKQKLEAQKQAVQHRVLMSNWILAYLGDPYGLRRMGERYQDGDGVPKDLAKARDYLSQAATAGDPSAADELLRLGQSTNAPAGQ